MVENPEVLVGSEIVSDDTDEEEIDELKPQNSKKARLDGEKIIIEDIPVNSIISLASVENSDDIVIDDLTAQDVFNILLIKCKLVIFSYQNLKEINSNERNIVSTTLIQHFLNKNPCQK